MKYKLVKILLRIAHTGPVRHLPLITSLYRKNGGTPRRARCIQTIYTHISNSPNVTCLGLQVSTFVTVSITGKQPKIHSEPSTTMGRRVLPQGCVQPTRAPCVAFLYHCPSMALPDSAGF